MGLCLSLWGKIELGHLGCRTVGLWWPMGPWGCWVVGPWACETNAPLDLLLCSGKSVVAWKACYGRKRRNGASLRLVEPSLSPGLRLRSYLKVRFRVQHGISVRKPRPHCRIFWQNVLESVHSGPIAAIPAIFHGT